MVDTTNLKISTHWATNSPQQPSRTHSSALYFLSFSSHHRHLHPQDPCHASCHSWSGCSVDDLPYQHHHMAVCIRGPVSDSHFNTNSQTMKIIRSGLQVRPQGLNLNSFTYQTYKKYTVRRTFSNAPLRPTPISKNTSKLLRLKTVSRAVGNPNRALTDSAIIPQNDQCITSKYIYILTFHKTKSVYAPANNLKKKHNERTQGSFSVLAFYGTEALTLPPSHLYWGHAADRSLHLCLHFPLPLWCSLPPDRALWTHTHTTATLPHQQRPKKLLAQLQKRKNMQVKTKISHFSPEWSLDQTD